MNALAAKTASATRQFLIRCLRAALAAEETPPAAPVDWALFRQLVAFHRVAALLERAVQAGRLEALPAAARAELADDARSLSPQALLLTGELQRLLQQLAEQGVEAIPLKGPALAVWLYGDPAMRHYQDLDLLVHAADLPTAKRALLALGYQPDEPYRYNLPFKLARGAHEIEVELHWSLLPAEFPLRLDLAGLWARRRPLALGGLQTASLAPEDLLLYLCVHGSKHLWIRLQWLCDVTQLLRRSPGLDWERALAGARRAGGLRALSLGLRLANEVLGAPLPPEIAAQLGRDPLTDRLAARVRQRLWYGPPPENVRWFKKEHFRVQLIDRPWDRLAYWLYYLTTPNAADLAGLPLPRALFPLYALLRPARLVCAYGPRLAGQFFHRSPKTKES